jgi:hypothetical protein
MPEAIQQSDICRHTEFGFCPRRISNRNLDVSGATRAMYDRHITTCDRTERSRDADDRCRPSCTDVEDERVQEPRLRNSSSSTSEMRHHITHKHEVTNLIAGAVDVSLGPIPLVAGLSDSVGTSFHGGEIQLAIKQYLEA